MQITFIEHSKLRKNGENPRKITKNKIKELANSLIENPDFFIARPILCDKNFLIWGGHQRFEAVKFISQNKDLFKTEKLEFFFNKIPENKTPIIILDLPKEKLKEIMIRDNVSSGDWDTVILSDFNVDDLSSWGLEINEELTENFILDAEQQTESKNKKIKKCPHCGKEI